MFDSRSRISWQAYSVYALAKTANTKSNHSTYMRGDETMRERPPWTVTSSSRTSRRFFPFPSYMPVCPACLTIPIPIPMRCDYAAARRISTIVGGCFYSADMTTTDGGEGVCRRRLLLSLNGTQVVLGALGKETVVVKTSRRRRYAVAV